MGDIALMILDRHTLK